jgi:hypothetical protein
MGMAGTQSVAGVAGPQPQAPIPVPPQSQQHHPGQPTSANQSNHSVTPSMQHQPNGPHQHPGMASQQQQPSQIHSIPSHQGAGSSGMASMHQRESGLPGSSNFGSSSAMGYMPPQHQQLQPQIQQHSSQQFHETQSAGHGVPGYPGSRINPQGEMQHLQQQLQHLYTLPSNPQTQQQIAELHERMSTLQRQGWSGGMPVPQPFMGGPASTPYMPQVNNNFFSLTF